jgi:peptidoglycan/xylan/chitin deacetylase (PgdA/CDA1 family)
MMGQGIFIQAIYYHLKPLIPRWLQIRLRRGIVLRKRLLCANTWPIDKNAGAPPPKWCGWPDKKKFALVLTHDVDTARGQERCIPLVEMEEKLGFKSSFNFVSGEYEVSPRMRDDLSVRGFEVGVHGLTHFGNPFRSRKIFDWQAVQINRYLRDWQSVGFRCPSMFHNLAWLHDLNIEYDSSTFDTDPFEPQPEGMGTIFPLWVSGKESGKGYVELPYTLPQDFTLFVLMKERNIDIWKQKLDWIVEKGGMALLLTHPDYLNFGGKKTHHEEYPVGYYEEFLHYIKSNYSDQYWHVLPRDLARFWSKRFSKTLE